MPHEKIIIGQEHHSVDNCETHLFKVGLVLRAEGLDSFSMLLGEGIGIRQTCDLTCNSRTHRKTTNFDNEQTTAST